VDFPVAALKNHRGQFNTIDDFKGKTVLVNFWFSTCPPCLDEMKYFPELLNRYDDLVIMSISIDSESHTYKLLAAKPAPWTFLNGDHPRWMFYNVDKQEKNGLADRLNVKSFPTYFLLDREGKIISSPEDGIYGVEKEMGGWLSHSLSLKHHFNNANVKKMLKAFLLFNLLAGIVMIGLFYYKGN
jgi:thiol-disulfide isomerase/thioredoxin